MINIRALAAVLASICAFQTNATAQQWPSRQINIVVPFAAGGSTDVAARLIGQHLSRAFDQKVVVENRTGANGNLGTEMVAKAAPDGHTLLVVPESIVSNAHVYKVNYDPKKDFVPVIQISRQPIVLAAHPELGIKTIAELVALAKKQPGMRYATGSGAGSQQHMVTAWFAKLAGIQLEQVSYRGGGQAINDLIAGHVKLGTLGSTPLIPHYRAGKLLLLAQSTAQRSPALPEVPTFREAGIELASDQWLGVFVPAGTPDAIVARLNTEVGKALADPALRKNLEDSAQEPVGGTAAAFAKLVNDDYAKFEKLVKELNIKVN